MKVSPTTTTTTPTTTTTTTPTTETATATATTSPTTDKVRSSQVCLSRFHLGVEAGKVFSKANNCISSADAQRSGRAPDIQPRGPGFDCCRETGLFLYHI